MTEENFKCTFTPTNKGLHAHVVDKSVCGNVFYIEGLENSVNGVDGTCYSTLGTNVDKSGDADLVTGVWKERKMIARLSMLPMRE